MSKSAGEDIRKTRTSSMNCPIQFRPCSGHAAPRYCNSDTAMSSPDLSASQSGETSGSPKSRASPSRREEGSNDLIFVAIQMSSAESVHRLLQYSADPRSREAVPSRERHAGRRRLRRRTALEAAASQPRCRQVILDFMAST